jgi:hypothetical protein
MEEGRRIVSASRRTIIRKASRLIECVGAQKTGDTHKHLQARDACQQGKEQTMTDTNVHNASNEVLNSTRDANQALVNTTVTVLDRNAKFAQTTFLSGIEVLERETDDMRNLGQEWEQQIQRQQEAFQKLASGTMATYMNFSRAWFSLSQQVWGATRSAVDRAVPAVQDATQRTQQQSP